MNPTFSIFPKFFQDLSVPELAQFVRDVGLDTTNAIIRPGYWADPENLGPTLSAFVSSMRDEGLEVTFVTTGWSPADIIADEEVLGTWGMPPENWSTGYVRISRTKGGLP
jgi:hypothetical protein